MSEIDRLVGKHRAHGLLIDTNLFLLLLVGATNEQRIERFDRTQKYTIQDFRRLSELTAQFKTVVTTPHILTEVGNLARIREPELTTLRRKFRDIVERTSEVYEASRALIATGVFQQLGLADAAIAAAGKAPLLVLTDDLELFRTLRILDIDAINFNHVRLQ